MNSKRVYFLASAFLFVALSFQSCDLSGVRYISSNSNTRHAASSQPSEDSLKPCEGSLAPGESCALKVQFTPTAKGTRSGTLQIRSNGEVIEEIALTGQGE